MRGRVLVIAGSDSSGGAGIQADIKTITVLGGYAATAITALTAQNTTGVLGIRAVPAAFVCDQIRAVLDDIGADAVKTGMLPDAALIEAVADLLEGRAERPAIVIDPVMVAKGGATLAGADALAAIVKRLLPLATVVTPNVPEAEALTGRRIASTRDLASAGEAILQMGAAAALVKGGHLDDEAAPGEVVDVLVTRDRPPLSLHHPRIRTRHTHGTGCTLASAIATGLSQGKTLEESVSRARAFVARAIENAPGFGSGHGPLGHAAAGDPSDR